MICLKCGARLKDGLRYCNACGNPLYRPTESRNGGAARSAVPVSSVRTAKAAGGGGLLLGRAARAARLQASYDPKDIISDRAYNAVLLGVLFWGLLVNVVLCVYVRNVYEYVSPTAFLIGYAVLVIAGTLLAGRSRNPLVSFLGYNMVVVPFGLLISMLVEAYGGVDSSVVTLAFVYTLLISLGMTAAAVAFPNLFQKLGGALLGLLIGLVLCEVLLLLFGIRQDALDWIAAGLFSLYIGYDVYRSQQFAKTLDNAVDSALDIYLDIANLFIRLLEIFGRKNK